MLGVVKLTSQMFPSRPAWSAHMSAPLNQAMFWPPSTPLKTVAVAKEERAMMPDAVARKSFIFVDDFGVWIGGFGMGKVAAEVRAKVGF